MATTTVKTRGKRRPKPKRGFKSKSPHSIEKESSHFRKEDVNLLGGNEEDYQWLQDVDNSEEELQLPQRGRGKDVDANQLKTFIKSLGFDKVQSKTDEMSSEEPSSDYDDTSTKGKQTKLKSRDRKSAKDATSESNRTNAKNNETDLRTKLNKSKKAREQTENRKQTNLDYDKKKKIQHEEVSSTTTIVTGRGLQGTADTRKLLNGYVARSYLLITPGEEKWYESQFTKDPTQFEPVDASVVSEYLKLAAKLYQDEVAFYASTISSDASSKAEWMRKVVASGVLSDKIAALILQTHKSPIHNTNSLDTVLNMVRKKGRREALLALKEVKQLFLEELLPDNRKLKLFSQHPFLALDKMSQGKSRDKRDRRLLMWYFEAQVKQKYEAFVASLETMCHDNVSAVKQKAMAAMEELLAAKPEQEKVLLTQIVNKIGDPDNKVAAKAVYLLQKLVEGQPAMKCVVVKEIEGILYRVNIRAKAQYYAMCFLNQMILTHEESELASKLIVIYFSFFKACTKKKDIDQKMLSAVLTGVNRAYPYAKVDDSKMEAEVNTLFQVVHASPFNIGVQSLLLLKQVLGESYSVSDRFYSALYKKLLDPTLENSPRQPMFLNLLYQTAKADVQVKRNKAFVKRLLQVCKSQQPAFICGALFLVSELMRLKPELKAIMHVLEGDDEEEHFVDIPASRDQDCDKEDEFKEDEKSNEVDAAEDKPSANTGQSTASSWVHHELAKTETKVGYDPLGRNPLYCGAETSALWELQKLTKHYHPSVILFAEALLRGDVITYTGNPLKDFTLMKFLERFVYKNPKQDVIEKGSVLQPQTKNYKPSAMRLVAVNSKKFINTPEDQIPIDELFFHRFFQQQGKQLRRTKVVEDTKDEDGDDDLDSDVEIDSDISDDEFDQILDGLEKEEDEDAFDFAGEFTRKQKSGKKQKSADSSDDDDDDDEDGASSDEEDYLNPDLDDDSDHDDDDTESFKMDGAEDFDEEGFGGSEDGGMDFDVESSKKRKGKQEVGGGKRKKARKSEKKTTSLQATVEQVATILDENIGAKFDSIGLQALANKDKADLKQLDWEMKRDMWMRGQDPKSKIKEKADAKSRGKRAFNKGNSQKRKRNSKGGKGKGKQKRKK